MQWKVCSVVVPFGSPAAEELSSPTTTDRAGLDVRQLSLQHLQFIDLREANMDHRKLLMFNCHSPFEPRAPGQCGAGEQSWLMGGDLKCSVPLEQLSLPTQIRAATFVGMHILQAAIPGRTLP